MTTSRSEIDALLPLYNVPGPRVVIVLIGLGPGLLVALWAARSVRALLFDVPTVDPVTMLLTVAVCLGMAMTGAWVPARRAVSVSPMSAMRSE